MVVGNRRCKPVHISDYKTLRRIKATLKQGTVHMGKKAMVIAFLPKADYLGCYHMKDETAAIAPVIKAFFELWYSDPHRYKERGPCSTVQFDSAAYFCHAGTSSELALHNITYFVRSSF